jgi:dipeptidyl-peptidase-4
MKALAMTLLAATSTEGNFLREFAETRRYLAGRPTNAQLTPDSKSVLFLRAAQKDPRQLLYELDLASGEARELLTPESLLKGAAETLRRRGSSACASPRAGSPATS